MGGHSGHLGVGSTGPVVDLDWRVAKAPPFPHPLIKPYGGPLMVNVNFSHSGNPTYTHSHTDTHTHTYTLQTPRFSLSCHQAECWRTSFSWGVSEGWNFQPCIMKAVERVTRVINIQAPDYDSGPLPGPLRNTNLVLLLCSLVSSFLPSFFPSFLPSLFLWEAREKSVLTTKVTLIMAQWGTWQPAYGYSTEAN